jgi:hypothetical protein
MHTTMEELLEAVFSMTSVQSPYNYGQRQSLASKDMSMVAEECALLDGYQARASEEIPD